MKPAIPDVLAARYASTAMATLWSPEHKVRLERRLWLAVLQAQDDLGINVPPARSRPTTPCSTTSIWRRSPNASGSPARRQGAHRGVQRPGRPRADPQGHDLARPHRERRATPDSRGAHAGTRQDGGGARPAGPTGRRIQRTAPGRTLPQRRRANHDARQAVRQRRRRDAGRTRGWWLCSTATRCAASRARWALRRTCSTCSAATRSNSPNSNVASPPTSVSDLTLTSVGQVYPRSLDYDVLSTLVQLGAGPSSLATTIRLMAGHELVTEGSPPARSAPARCRTR